MTAYIDPNITPIQRIRFIWFPIFIRRYIENQKEFTLKDNFLSSNCYLCIELNGHSLIQIMVHLKEINRPELFLPHLFDSQQCESTFRQFRSLSSTYSTVINCTFKEAASRLSKIQLQNEIMHNISENYVYPRLKTQSEKPQCNRSDLPTIEEIIAEMKNCQNDAIATSRKFNLIDKRCAKNIECRIKRAATLNQLNKPQKILTANRMNIEHLDISNIQLKDYTGKLKNTAINVSPYVEIMRDNGLRTIIKKTSLCWLL